MKRTSKFERIVSAIILFTFSLNSTISASDVPSVAAFFTQSISSNVSVMPAANRLSRAELQSELRGELRKPESQVSAGVPKAPAFGRNDFRAAPELRFDEGRSGTAWTLSDSTSSSSKSELRTNQAHQVGANLNLSWTTPAKGVENIRSVLKKQRPLILKRYNRFPELTSDQIELLKQDVYGIT